MLNHCSTILAVVMFSVVARGRADDNVVLRLDHYVELRHPKVARAVGISDARSREIQRLFRPLYLQVADSVAKYPRGAQDGEGEEERELRRSQIETVWSGTLHRCEALLTEDQKSCLFREAPMVWPSRNITYESVVFFGAGNVAGLPQGVSERLALTAEQKAEIIRFHQSEKPELFWRDCQTQSKSIADAEQLFVGRLRQHQKGLVSKLTPNQRRLLESIDRDAVKRAHPWHVLSDGIKRLPKGPVMMRGDWSSSDRVCRIDHLSGSSLRLTRNTGSQKGEFIIGHPAAYVLTCSTFSDDGRLLATGAMTLRMKHERESEQFSGGEIRIWNTETGELLGVATAGDLMMIVTGLKFRHNIIIAASFEVLER